MASADDGETLETLLNKATSPLNREDDWEFIMDFCDRVNSELEGVLTATRLLVHKMQSPQEREAMQALTVLEACVKNCGEAFHKELGKYRFLNELIKLVSPKYLGTKTSDKVQQKVITMLYTWSVALTEQVKIRDAYQMLKKQGIVTVDPDFNQNLISNPPVPRPERDTLFTDEEKKKQLDKLLKSSRPEDLQAANRLIKNVVKEDEERMEKVRKRMKTLEEVNNNVKLLNEMLTHFNPDESAIADMQMMKELYEGCQKLRPTLFRLASDTDDEESALMDILRANDDVSRVMTSYEKLVLPKLSSVTDRKADGAPEPSRQEMVDKEPSSLLELSGLSFQPSIATTTASSNQINDTFNSFHLSKPSKQSTTNGLDDNLFLNFQSAPATSPANDVNSLLDLGDIMVPAAPIAAPTPSAFITLQAQIPKLPTPPQPKEPSKPTLFADIDELSRGLMEKSLGGKPAVSFPEPSSKPTLNEMSLKKEVKSAPTFLSAQADTSAIFDVTAPTSNSTPQLPAPLVQPTVPVNQPSQPTVPEVDASLNDVFVPLESIRPSTFAPLTAYDNNGIRIMLHFAKDHATPVRTDTLVSVISIMSTRTSPVQNVIFQAAAPKIMKVKLQPPSNTELPAFNPIFSSPPLTQIMIIANPSKKEVKIRFKLDYKIDPQTAITENGLIAGFPPVEDWGSL